MRIVGGKYKGRALVEFDGNAIRPTADKVRESLFNILQFRISGASVLDLFCGTGAIGIEALSRGAKTVVFNDASRESIAVLKKNLNKLKVSEEYRLQNSDALTFLKNTTDTFDLVYIDPPYKSDLGGEALKLVSRALNYGGTAVFEDEKPFSGEACGIVKTDERKYGRVYLTFFRREE